MTIAGALLVVAMVAAGVVSVVWALWGDRARGRRRCPRCWYDMSAVQGLRCPECGRAAGAERRLFKTRRRWRWVAAGMLLWLAAGGVYLGDVYRVHGWPGMPRLVVLAWLPVGDLRPASTTLTDVEARRLYVMAFAPISYRRLTGWEEAWEVRILRWRLRRDADAEGRAMAAVYLHLVARAGVPILPARDALVGAVDDADAKVEWCAALTLAEAFGDDPGLDELWLRLLREGRSDTSRSYAAMSLGRRGAAGDLSHLPTLIAAMESALQDPLVHSGTAITPIAQAVAMSRSEAALAAFVRMLDSEDVMTRYLAANSLELMGESGAAAVPALIRNLRGDSSLQAAAYVRAIGAMGEHGRDAVPLLIEGMDHPQDVFGNRCMTALGRVGRGDERVARALVAQLTSTRYGHKHRVVEALAAIGWKATEARDLLEAMVRGEDAGLRIWAGLILARTDGEMDRFVQDMIALIRADQLPVWDIEHAIDALGVTGPDAHAAVPLLQKLSQQAEGDDAWWKKEAATRALRAIEGGD